jgi:hypothetical protein
MLRIAGDTLALTPPLIISEEQIGEIIDKGRQGRQGGGVNSSVIASEAKQSRTETVFRIASSLTLLAMTLYLQRQECRVGKGAKRRANRSMYCAR